MGTPPTRSIPKLKLNLGLYAEAAAQAKQSGQTLRGFLCELLESALAERRSQLQLQQSSTQAVPAPDWMWTFGAAQRHRIQ